MSTAEGNGFWIAGARAAEREGRSNDQIKRGEKIKKLAATRLTRCVSISKMNKKERPEAFYMRF
jgi:hypothetical protein